MNERPTAQIIPFPKRPAAVQTQPPAVSLPALSAILEEQRASVEAWESAVHDLSNSMKMLSGSLDQFKTRPEKA